MTSSICIEEYNTFCSSIKVGSILYNINSTNYWGEYLLVADKVTIKIDNLKTYTILLLGLSKEGSNYKPRELSITLTPDDANNVPFLKPVGYCTFKLVPQLNKISVDKGLIAAYSDIDLHKYANRLSIRKPKTSKYDHEGKLVIKKTYNN